jgi:hypothetical protein
MAWLESEPAPVLISVETYFESRPNPNGSGSLQLRKRGTINSEYRGVSLNRARLMCIFYPIVSLNSITTRTARPIGGGGYTVTESQDTASGEWTDEPLQVGVPADSFRLVE